MQFIIFCLFVIAIVCMVLGYRKSAFRQESGPRQHCAICGWTQEQVQLCQFEQPHKTMVAPLCFDCSIEHDALPIRGTSIGAVHAA